ncbi:putative acetyltransferase [Bacillus sp. TS-2]|nr:putative acetyltransferase [Bacillus sp. TS-2]
MIRKLTEKDHQECMNLVSEKPAENLFIIGDIEAYGYEQAFQTLWGDFDEQQQLRAVLLNYRGNFIPYCPTTDFDYKGFAEVISKHEHVDILSGLEYLTSLILPHVTLKNDPTRRLYYAKCESIHGKPNNLYSNVQAAQPEDAVELVEFINSIEEFDTRLSVEEKKEALEQKVSRSYFIRMDEQIVSSVSTAAENSQSAMVVAVCTRKGFEQRGYASSCLYQLVHDLINENKSLCLFYDNPHAGKIYKNLGFEDIANWTMTKLIKE